MKTLLTILIALCLALSAFSQPVLPGTPPPTLVPIANPYSGSWIFYTTDSISGLSFLGGINSTNATNIFNSLLVGSTNSYVSTLYGNATNVDLFSNVFFGPFPTLIVDTNRVGIFTAGVGAAKGSYRQIANGIWTNLAGNLSAIVFMNPTYFLQTNNVSLYSASSLAWNSVWLNVVGSTQVPTNSGYGYIFNHAGLDVTNLNADGLIGILPMVSLDTTKVLTNNEIAPVTFDSANAFTNQFGGSTTILGARVQEGIMTSSTGTGGHAEGDFTVTDGQYGHSEGAFTMSHGNYSHAEGLSTLASGQSSHAAGQNAQATNDNSWVWTDGTTYGSLTNQTFTVYARKGINLQGSVISGNGGGLTNLNTSAGGFISVSTNTIKLASSLLTYTNLWAASLAAVDGDTIYVGPGTYIEGNSVCTFPKNVSIFPLGAARLYISLTNPHSFLVESNIYIRPTDNMKIFPGLQIFETTSNVFNAIFGYVTNTPSATNWQVSITGYHADSDGFYFANPNKLFTGTLQDCIMQGWWDTMADMGNNNVTNLTIFNNCQFFTTYSNGFTTPTYRPINVQSSSKYIFNGGSLHATKQNNQNVGAYLNNGNQVILNGVGFDISGSGYNDIQLNGTGTNNFNGCYTYSGQPLVVNNGNFIQANSSPWLGGIDIPLNLSFDSGFPGYDFGDWLIMDSSINGNILITNRNNTINSSVPAWMVWQANNDGLSIPGALAVHNMAFTGDGNGITNMASTGFINITNGQIFTNLQQRVMSVKVPVIVTQPATTLGSAEIDAEIGPVGGAFRVVDGLDIAGAVTSIIATNKATLVFDVPPGYRWAITNSLSGTGYTASLDAAKTNTATFY